MYWHWAYQLNWCKAGLPKTGFPRTLASVAAIYVGPRMYHRHQTRRRIEERGQQARLASQELNLILTSQNADLERHTMIVTMSTQSLQEKLQNGELKAVEVLQAFQKKAMEVNMKLNCVTEPILEAEAVAQSLDLLPPEKRGPLHGIPVSIKESISIKGYDCTGGLQALAFQNMERDAEIVQVLKNLGAVPFVRTNFPQTLMTFACSNPIYGQTLHPLDARRGPGGSSGGEGALIGGGGSVIGIGSDIGGSIRLPSSMCGVYGLKPTACRVGSKGHYAVGSGQTLVKLSVGPMARDMSGLVLATKAFLSKEHFDINPYLPPVPFRNEVFEKRDHMRIGFYVNVDGLQPHPAGVRAVLQAKAALENLGHTVIEFQPPQCISTFFDTYVAAVFGDKGEEVQKYLDKDIVDQCIRTMYRANKMSSWTKYVIGGFLQLQDPLLGQAFTAQTKLPEKILDWWHLQDKIEAYKERFLEAWQSKELDAVIGPVTLFPAVSCGKEVFFAVSLAVTALYNLLDYPAGSLPVTIVNEEDVAKVNCSQCYPLTGFFEKAVKKDSAGSVGLPMGVQCIGLPYQEEVVLRLMQELDTAFRNLQS